MSLSGEAAIYGKGDANDEAGAGAAQQEDGGGDLLAAAEAPDRCRGNGLGPVELALGGHVGDFRGLDGAGADGVDADPARRSMAVLVVSPAMEEQLTMAPLPWARIWPSSCFMHAQPCGGYSQPVGPIAYV
jgi:hypothetical protein